MNSISGQLTVFEEKGLADFERAIPLASGLQLEAPTSRKKDMALVLMNKTTNKEVICIEVRNEMIIIFLGN